VLFRSKRSFIVARDTAKDESSDWISMIHPVQAMILSFFTHGKPYSKVVTELSLFLEKKEEEVKQLLSPFINNAPLKNTFEGKDFYFPPNILVESEVNNTNPCNPSDFEFKELDFATSRMISGPLNLTFMMTTRCMTDCIYCYADKRKRINTTYSPDRFAELILEAKKMNVVDIGLIGGEFFIYPHWREVLDILSSHNYYPDLLSTKMPLDDEQLEYISKIQDKTLFQFSLDSTNPEILKKIWNVDNKYLDRVRNTFEKLQKWNIRTQVATTLTSFSDEISEIKAVYEYISRFSVIDGWDVGPAFFSLYKGKAAFEHYKCKKSRLNAIEDYLNTLKEDATINIDFDSSFSDKNYYAAEGGSDQFEGAQCSANWNHLFILPDGNVSICEQLYWNPDFIVGNIMENNIKDVWDSEIARKFANLKPGYFQDSSICKRCEYFDACHNANNKCWVEIIKAYGEKNWDYPDPRCIMAPAMKNDLIFY